MEKVFDVPTYFVAQYVSEQMRKETSFLIEGTSTYPLTRPTLLRSDSHTTQH